jgi:hypothetical protein
VRCRDDTGEIKAVRDAPREREPLWRRSIADPMLMVNGCRFYQRNDTLEPTRQTSRARENNMEHGSICLAVRLIHSRGRQTKARIRSGAT